MQNNGLNQYDAPDEITTLQQFYSLMGATCSVRRRLVKQVLNSQECKESDLAFLRKSLELLKAIPHSGDSTIRLALDKERSIDLEIGYETNELERDLIFLSRGEDALYDYFRSAHDDFDTQVTIGVEKWKHLKFRNLITDRDGTVNNYCGRYLSSIQSVYNAVFLSRFARDRCENAVVLTSAPLAHGGLVDISTSDDELFIYAGSKGREYHAPNGKRGNFPIDPNQQQMLDTLNERIGALVAKSEYEKYTLIGSGFQKKFGQSTIARQDISQSIPQQESVAFLQLIQNLVSDLDPQGKYFRIEDTGKDIEILLTVSDKDNQSSGLRDFDKGDGVGFLDKALSLLVSEGPNLICGDTASDVPMLGYAKKQNKTNTHACFVTTEQTLSRKVQALEPQALIVTEPDVLVTILHELTK